MPPKWWHFWAIALPLMPVSLLGNCRTAYLGRAEFWPNLSAYSVLPISPRLALRHGRDLCPFKAVYLTYTWVATTFLGESCKRASQTPLEREPREIRRK